LIVDGSVVAKSVRPGEQVKTSSPGTLGLPCETAISS